MAKNNRRKSKEGEPRKRPGAARSQAATGLAAPWLRAPLLLFRYPGLLVAVFTAVVILAMAGAASPLFLSSSGNATLQRGIADTCPWEVGLKFFFNAPLAGDAIDVGFEENNDTALAANRNADRAFRTSLGAGLQHVGAVEGDISGSITRAAKTGRNPTEFESVRLYARDGGLDHVKKLAGPGGQGVWVPDTVATALGIVPGDSITFHGSLAQSETTARARVAGIYRNLLSEPRTSYWCTQEHLIYPLSAFENSNPPALVMTDRETFVTLANKLGERDATFTYDLPVRAAGLTLPAARELAGQIQGVMAELGGGGPSRGQNFPGLRRSSTLPFIVTQADATVVSLRRSVDTISLAGRIVALIVIAASGIYWVSRRRSEVMLLSARGVGAFGIGAKVLLEILPIGVIGAAAGWLAGLWLAKILGPTSLLDAAAPAAALRQVIGTVLIGVVLLAVVAALSARRETEGSPSRGREALARAPWELVVLALAAASLYEIISRGTRPVQTGGGPPKLDVLVLLFPILFVAGAAGLAVRLVGRFLPALRAGGGTRSQALFLASRRVAAAPRMALALVTATALAIGILVYAGTLTRSVAVTSDAKARVFVGSNVAATVAEDIPVPASLEGEATRVTVVDSAYLLPDQTPLKTLGVDPQTFASAAFWDRSFADKPLDALLKDLAAPADPQAPLPVLVAGGDLPATGGTLVFRGAPARIPVHVVDTVKAFPGMDPGRPIVVADQAALESRGAPGFSSIWSTADPATVRAALPEGVHIIGFGTAERVQQDPAFLSLSWALGFLQVLGIMAGLIVLGGILLYLEARQRSREVSYALGKRMGLTRAGHRRSVAVELGAMLGLGALLGAVLAWIAARLVYGQLDALPLIPPPPLFRTPIGLLAVTTAAIIVAAWVGAWRVQRAAEKARVAEVMRLAG